jgi:hypothetical protein
VQPFTVLDAPSLTKPFIFNTPLGARMAEVVLCSTRNQENLSGPLLARCGWAVAPGEKL